MIHRAAADRNSRESALWIDCESTNMLGAHAMHDDKNRPGGADDDPWLNVSQAAAHAGVCEKTIRRAYLSRQVRYTRVGRAIRFRRAWIDEWIVKAQVVAVA